MGSCTNQVDNWGKGDLLKGELRSTLLLKQFGLRGESKKLYIVHGLCITPHGKHELFV